MGPVPNTEGCKVQKDQSLSISRSVCLSACNFPSTPSSLFRCSSLIHVKVITMSFGKVLRIQTSPTQRTRRLVLRRKRPWAKTLVEKVLKLQGQARKTEQCMGRSWIQFQHPLPPQKGPKCPSIRPVRAIKPAEPEIFPGVACEDSHSADATGG